MLLSSCPLSPNSLSLVLLKREKVPPHLKHAEKENDIFTCWHHVINWLCSIRTGCSKTWDWTRKNKTQSVWFNISLYIIRNSCGDKIHFKSNRLSILNVGEPSLRHTSLNAESVHAGHTLPVVNWTIKIHTPVIPPTQRNLERIKQIQEKMFKYPASTVPSN